LGLSTRCSPDGGLTAKTDDTGDAFGSLGSLLSGFATRVGGFVADQQLFGWTSTRIDLCYFNNSFPPLDGGSQWGRRYGQRLACWKGAWW
jgi:hypothetical protein